jgi:hypothetical protein
VFHLLRKLTTQKFPQPDLLLDVRIRVFFVSLFLISPCLSLSVCCSSVLSPLVSGLVSLFVLACVSVSHLSRLSLSALLLNASYVGWLLLCTENGIAIFVFEFMYILLLKSVFVLWIFWRLLLLQGYLSWDDDEVEIWDLDFWVVSCKTFEFWILHLSCFNECFKIRMTKSKTSEKTGNLCFHTFFFFFQNE